jgi:hypothetical protein
LVALAVYGSSVDGSFIPTFSDLDVAVFLHGEFDVEDAIAVQGGLSDLEPAPFAYIQVKFHDVDASASPTLVPGSFSVLWGKLPKDPSYLYDDNSLRRVTESWLERLAALIADDRAAWSVAAGAERRQRLVRLMMTRLKPAVRSMLVRQGEPPVPVWLAGWGELTSRWREHDVNSAARLASLLAALPPQGREQEVACGEEILRLLSYIRGVASRPADP